jgi:hypothetical protein
MKGSAISRLLCGFLLALTVMSFTACKGKNKDGEIQTAFNSKVQNDPNLAGVSASVVEGTVTLTGTWMKIAEPVQKKRSKTLMV